MKKIADEEKRELLQEILMSPGWSIFCNHIVREVMDGYTRDLFTAARNGDGTENAIGKFDGVVDLLKSTYEAANIELPEFFSKMRRNGI